VIHFAALPFPLLSDAALATKEVDYYMPMMPTYR
jgi:hypothetical protein